MRVRASWAVLSLTALLAATGCKDKAEEGEKAATEQPAATEKTAEDKASDEGAKAEAPKAEATDPACVGPFEKGTPSKKEVAGWNVETDGYLVTFTGGEKADGELVLGVLGDIKEDTGENLFNLDRYQAWFDDKGVEAIVVTGDSAESQDGIVRVLDKLAASDRPVFVIIGNRESRDAYQAAVSEVQKKHENVFDLTERRMIRFPEATLVSLPGYYDATYIHAEDGCAYSDADVKAMVPVIKESAKDPVVLISHGPPRGKTAEAIDRIKGDNVGDPAMNELVNEADVEFGLFGNIHEAGGRATDLTGENLVAQGEYAESFYLNPGPADSIRWEMNDGTESTGMASVVSIKDGKAAYWIYRAEPLTEAQRAEAAKLAPKTE